MMQATEDGAARGRIISYLWAVIAAFGVYFCMYGLRRPFTASTQADYGELTQWGVDYKTLAVTFQLLGYVISKFIGVRVVSEMARERRAIAVALLLSLAWASLLAWPLLPAPWNLSGMFVNGLMLGMVFGLVMSFLEGRRVSEALLAGLCASFIVADGVMKSWGTWLLTMGCDVFWMPLYLATAFLPLALLFVWMLSRIPSPDQHDERQRSARTAMNAEHRRAMLLQLRWGLMLILGVYILTTMMRSIRTDFAPEIWAGLNYETRPSLFSISESLVALGVMVIAALGIMIVNNRKAFMVSLALSSLGMLLVLGAISAHRYLGLSGYLMMVLIGLGLYLPYVLIHTTVFERLIAMTRVQGNVGFLMYLADALGYAVYVALLWGRSLSVTGQRPFTWYLNSIEVLAVLGLLLVLGATWYFRQTATIALVDQQSLPSSSLPAR